MKTTSKFIAFGLAIAAATSFTSLESASAQSHEQVVEAAKKEGKFIIGDTTSEADFRPVLRAFMAAHPYLKAEHFSAGGNGIFARLRQEYQARAAASVDVFIGGETSALEMLKGGELAKTDWKALGVDEKLIRNESQIIGATVITVLGWNTKLLNDADVPKTWDELVDPKWKGKVVVPVAGWGTMAADLSEVWGEERATQFTLKIKSVASTVAAIAEVAPRVGSGEFALGLMRIHQAKNQVKRGAPLKFAPLDPVPCPLLAWQIPANAQNPNAARLFMRWVASPEGQKIYEAAAGRGNPYIEGTETAKLLNGLNLAIYAADPKSLAVRDERENRLQRLLQSN